MQIHLRHRLLEDATFLSIAIFPNSKRQKRLDQKKGSASVFKEALNLYVRRRHSRDRVFAFLRALVYRKQSWYISGHKRLKHLYKSHYVEVLGERADLVLDNII